MKKLNLLVNIFAIIIIISNFIFLVYFIYSYFIEPNEVVIGFYLNGDTLDNLKTVTQQERYKGDWVCIDVSKQEFKEAISTCYHEVGHHSYFNKTPKEEYLRNKSEEFAEEFAGKLDNCMGDIDYEN